MSQNNSPRLLCTWFWLLFLLGLSPATKADNLDLISHVGGSCVAVGQQGNIAFTGFGSTLAAVDITSVSLPKLVGQLSLPGAITNMVVHGQWAYVILDYHSLQIVNLADPMALAITGSYEIPNLYDYGEPAYHIKATGNMLYATGAYGQLVIIDVSNPARPVKTGQFTAWNEISDLAVCGGLIYLTGWDYNHGNGIIYFLQVVDVTDSANPVSQSIYKNFAPGAIAVSGAMAYVLYNDTLSVFDIGNPAAPAKKGTCYLNEVQSGYGSMQNIIVSGDTAYCTGAVNGIPPFAKTVFITIDLSQPDKPVEIGHSEMPSESSDGSLSNPGGALFVSGDHALLAAGQNGLKVMSIADPAKPAVAGRFTMPARTRAVALGDRKAYVSDADNGLYIYDLSNPASPVLQSTTPEVRAAEAMALAGGMAYLAGEAGLQVVDVRDPLAPVPRGDCNTTGSAVSIAIADNFAYLATGADGLQIADLSNPDQPRIEGHYDTPGNTLGVTVVDKTAYLADDTNGLLIVDIHNPAQPVLLGFYNVFHSAKDVAVVGHHAYVADDGEKLWVIDVGNPHMPLRLGVCDAYGALYRLAISGQIVFACSRPLFDPFNVETFNVADPTAPVRTGRYPISVPYLPGITTAGNDVCVSSDLNGYYIMRYSGIIIQPTPTPTPTPAPTPMPSPTPLPGWNVALYGSYGGSFTDFVFQGRYGYRTEGCNLAVVDLESEGAPEVGAVSLPEKTLAVRIDGNFAYVLGASFGLYVIDISNPLSPRMHACLSSGGVRGFYLGAMALGDHLLCFSYNEFKDGKTWGSDDLKLIRIIDVSNPAAPVLRSICDTQQRAFSSLAVANGIIYAISPDRNWLNTIKRIDVRDPSQPRLLSSFGTPQTPSDLSVIGGILCVANGDKGFTIYDIQDAEPKLLSTYTFPPPDPNNQSRIERVAILDGAVHALVGAYTWKEWIDEEDGSVYGDYVWVKSELRTYSLANPAAPVEINHFDLEKFSTITFTAQGLWAKDSSGNYRAIRFSPAGLPTLSLTCAALPPVKGLATVFGQCYTATSQGVQIISLDSSGQPILRGVFSGAGDVKAVAMADGLVCALTNTGINLLDLLDPSHPVKVGSCSTPYGNHLAVSGKLACIAGSPSFVDLSVPAAPVARGQYSPEIMSWEANMLNVDGLALSGHMAYLGLSEWDEWISTDRYDNYYYNYDFKGNRLEMIDASNPDAPRRRSYISASDTLAHPASDHDYLFYLGGAGNELKVHDVSNPDLPVPVGSLTLPITASDLVVEKGLAYITGSSVQNGRSLQVVDVSDPAHPHICGSQQLPAYGSSLAVSDGLIFVAVSQDPSGDSDTRGVLAMSYNGPRPPEPLRVDLSGQSGCMVGRLRPNNPVYVDRAYTFTDPIPTYLVGQPYILTRNNDKNLTTGGQLDFSVNQSVRVFIALSSKIKSPPAWLSGWQRHEWRLSTTDADSQRVLFYRDFPAGQVKLGPNHSCPKQEFEKSSNLKNDSPRAMVHNLVAKLSYVSKPQGSHTHGKGRQLV